MWKSLEKLCEFMRSHIDPDVVFLFPPSIWLPAMTQQHTGPAGKTGAPGPPGPPGKQLHTSSSARIISTLHHLVLIAAASILLSPLSLLTPSPPPPPHTHTSQHGNTGPPGCVIPTKGVLRMWPCASSPSLAGADVCVSAACPVGSVLTGFGCQVTRGHATGFYVTDASGKEHPTGPLAQVICSAKSTNDYKQAHIWASAICSPSC